MAAASTIASVSSSSDATKQGAACLICFSAVFIETVSPYSALFRSAAMLVLELELPVAHCSSSPSPKTRPAGTIPDWLQLDVTNVRLLHRCLAAQSGILVKIYSACVLTRWLHLECGCMLRSSGLGRLSFIEFQMPILVEKPPRALQAFNLPHLRQGWSCSKRSFDEPRRSSSVAGLPLPRRRRVLESNICE